MEMEQDREVRGREPEEGWEEAEWAEAEGEEEWGAVVRAPDRGVSVFAPVVEQPFLIRSEFPALSRSARNAERLWLRDRR